MSKSLSSLPVGALIKDVGTTYNGKPIIWKVMQHGHSGDPENTTALVTERIITLKCFDAKESGNSDSNRRSYGNNRYSVSNIRQWLNSNDASWFAAQHSADVAPSSTSVTNYNPYSSEAGFLTNFSEDMRAALVPSTRKVVKASVDGGGSETVTDKIFLLSNTEVGLANESSIAEGSIYSLFNTASERQVKPTAEAVTQSTYKDASNLTATKAWYWWLRTPNASYSHHARIVYTDGTLNNSHAYGGGIGVRPACILSSLCSVSDSTDTDGAYILEWNKPPQITCDKTSLGDVNRPISLSFSFVEPEGEGMSAYLALDGAKVKDFGTVAPGASYSYTMTSSAYKALAQAAHKFECVATDEGGRANTLELPFTKVASSIMISGDDEELGMIFTAPVFTFSVESFALDGAFTVTGTVDGAEFFRQTGNGTGDFTADMTAKFASLSNEENHTVIIKAVNSEGSEYEKTCHFFKTADRLCFRTKPIPTDDVAQRIVVNINYDTTNAPLLKIEVSNNANDAAPVWEDMTSEVKAKKAHVFSNTEKTAEFYAVAVRVSIIKNAKTPRVYCNSLGFCYN